MSQPFGRYQDAGGVAEGGRNDDIYRYASSLNARRVSESDALTLCRAKNERNVPPLPDREVVKCVRSAFTHPAGHSAEFDRAHGMEHEVATATAARSTTPARSWDLHLPDPDELPEPPDLTPAEMLAAQVTAMFRPGDLANVVADGIHGQPCGAGVMYPPEELAAEAEDVLACGDPDSGMWLRVNPTSGRHAERTNADGTHPKAEGDADVTHFRHVLVECDPADAKDMTEEELAEAKRRQLARIIALRLPCACVVDSGHKSVHAIVRVVDPGEELTLAEWVERRDLIFDVCDHNELPHDPACKNPSRLCRLAGARRGAHTQALLATDIGCGDFTAWRSWVEGMAAQADTEETARPRLPRPRTLREMEQDPPEPRPPLIGRVAEDGTEHGILREGGLMYLTGASKSGKSWLADSLAVSIASGTRWLGMPCRRGRVLLCDFELMEGDLYKRIEEIVSYRSQLRDAPDYAALCADSLMPWPLRDYVAPLDELAGDIVLHVGDLARRSGRPVYGYIKMAIIDPLYMVEMGDENSASDMASLFRVVRGIQRQLGCAVCIVHHHPKGAAGGRDAIDRGAGSGATGRNGDAMVDMSRLFLDEAHQERINERHRAAYEENDRDDLTCYRVEFGGVRSFKTPRPVDLVWTYPVHTIADHEDRLFECPLVGADVIAEKNAARSQRSDARHDAINAAVSDALAACEGAGVTPTKQEVYARADWAAAGDVTPGQFGKLFEAKNAWWFGFRTVRDHGNTYRVEAAGT